LLLTPVLLFNSLGPEPLKPARSNLPFLTNNRLISYLKRFEKKMEVKKILVLFDLSQTLFYYFILYYCLIIGLPLLCSCGRERKF
jgi:hypothetical protein